MALKFLNKKGWHTGSLRNIENVWKAEQKHEAEQHNQVGSSVRPIRAEQRGTGMEAEAEVEAKAEAEATVREGGREGRREGERGMKAEAEAHCWCLCRCQKRRREHDGAAEQFERMRKG